MHCMSIYSLESMDTWNKNRKKIVGNPCKKKRTGCCTGVACSGNWTYFFYFIFAGHVQIFWNIVTIHCCITSSHFHVILLFLFLSSETPATFCHWLGQPICVLSFIIFIYFAHEWSFGKKKLSPCAKSHFHRHSVIEHCSSVIRVNTEYLNTSGTLQCANSVLPTQLIETTLHARGLCHAHTPSNPVNRANQNCFLGRSLLGTNSSFFTELKMRYVDGLQKCCATLKDACPYNKVQCFAAFHHLKKSLTQVANWDCGPSFTEHTPFGEVTQVNHHGIIKIKMTVG